MAVACGNLHTLTLDDNGDVWAFGYNCDGDCGLYNNDKDVEVPTKVHGLMNIVHIAAGEYFSACVDVNGHVWTFGCNFNGQLGHGDNDNRYTPTRVERLDNIVSVSCGYRFTICISSNYKVYTFGSNEYGQLGIGTNTKSEPLPVLVPLDVDIKQNACGAYHSVFLTYDGDVLVCGFNYSGQLGLGDNNNRNTPVKNPYLNDIVSVQGALNNTIVMNSEQQLFSFGDNYYGELCLNDNINRNKPEPIQFSEEISSFSCVEQKTMILDTSNRIWVFGMNIIGGDRIEGYHKAVFLNEPSDICLISHGGNHVLLKCTSNEIWAFGYNYHQLPLSIPETDNEDRNRVITKPIKLSSEYNHIIGTPTNRFKLRAKSARK